MMSSLQNQWNQVAAELTAIPLILERVRYAVALKTILTLPPGARILEAGCGAGRILRTLQALGYHNVTGLEISQSRLDYVKHAGGTSAELVCSDHVPFEDESFDAVVSAAVIEHVADPMAWLGELARVTRPGGMISITSDTYMWKWLKKLGMYKTVQPLDEAIWPAKLTAAAEAAGLEVVGCGGFTNVPDQNYYFLKQLKRWSSLRRRWYLWRGVKGRQHKPIPVYEHVDEIPGILQALDEHPLSAQKSVWSAIFSYESYYYLRKRGEVKADETKVMTTTSNQEMRQYRAAA